MGMTMEIAENAVPDFLVQMASQGNREPNYLLAISFEPNFYQFSNDGLMRK